eukprot:gnl/TRDRNA2_/TRDRNA2_179508_c0_seq1.p1 gnl/TRDRNA2_/TRDRNA2_179508_c0~~gnl/TRDRNA2_/TRDRNA2_179508_c0_seq1.p1  ORF type:complete len:626 (+),score=62.05 gnl/TRDRNA2_/TRDRNA2_179508_c0_seq1:109-1986(+)
MMRSFQGWVFAAVFSQALAFPSFRLKIPNGERVPCPEGVDGCTVGDGSIGQPKSVCSGVGHRSCLGGSMPLNAFGIALKAEGYKWTSVLCEADSDGDGLTNGEELGDPCCLWEESDSSSAYTATFPASHPGFADVDARKDQYARPDCSLTKPSAKAVALGNFNAGEEQRSVDLLVANFTLPAQRTIYVNIAWNFPDDSLELFHVVSAEAIIHTVNLHHFVLNGCEDRWPDDMHGKPVDSMTSQKCQTPWGAWAPGKKIVEMPPWLGVPLGKDAGVRAFVVQVHYDNPTLQAGIVSQDGVRLHYTPNLRSESPASLSIIKVSVAPTMRVPPGKKRFFITRSCMLTVSDAKTQAPAEMHVFGRFYHAHLLGTEMYTEFTPQASGVARDLGSDRFWHFDDQSMKNLLLENITLQTGDHIQSTCVMDSTGRETPTFIGEETIDEMCWNTLQTWPAGIEGKCNGSIWFGELSDDEQGMGIASRHPEEDAEWVWDGAYPVGPGHITKFPPDESYMDPRCMDMTALADNCPRITAMHASSGMDCDADLSDAITRLQEQGMQGATIMSLCCTEACSNHCGGHDLCSRERPPALASATTTAGPPNQESESQETSGSMHAIGSWYYAILLAPIFK